MSWDHKPKPWKSHWYCEVDDDWEWVFNQPIWCLVIEQESLYLHSPPLISLLIISMIILNMVFPLSIYFPIAILFHLETLLAPPHSIHHSTLLEYLLDLTLSLLHLLLLNQIILYLLYLYLLCHYINSAPFYLLIS